MISVLNMQSWSDHVLNLVNSTANTVAIVALAVALVSAGVIYFTGTELNGRAKQRKRPAPSDSTTGSQSRFTENEIARDAGGQPRVTTSSQSARQKPEAARAQNFEQAKIAHLTQAAAELAAVQRSDEAHKARISELEHELAAARRSEEARAARLMQLETELAAARQAKEASTARLAQTEKDLVLARREAQEAKASIGKVNEKQPARKLSPEQRQRFLDAIRGMPTGKVIISAFFNNKETHEIGSDLLGLLRDAGFQVVEPSPLDFFTTSRSSSGLRLGYQNTTSVPPHVMTLRKGFNALGLQAPTTDLVNAHESDVVEIQITPKE
jgi:hypothetical protein